MVDALPQRVAFHRHPKRHFSTGMIALVIGLAIFLPPMGASLILARVMDWLIFRRLGWFQGARA